MTHELETQSTTGDQLPEFYRHFSKLFYEEKDRKTIIDIIRGHKELLSFTTLKMVLNKEHHNEDIDDETYHFFYLCETLIEVFSDIHLQIQSDLYKEGREAIGGN